MSNEVLKIIGKNIRKTREDANMTIKELAKRSGIKECSIKKIEEGEYYKLQLSHLNLLADSMNILSKVLLMEI